MNRWGIPKWLEQEVKERDKNCIYCGIKMNEGNQSSGSRRTVATWEHIVNDAKIITKENIARCCVACNSSKGIKRLSEWIQSDYCRKNGINKNTVALIVRQALELNL